ncbi:MAG: hypothetical protein ACOCUO_02070 [archaeon]
MTGPPSPGRNPHNHPIGDDRGQALRLILINLRKIPGTEAVRFQESGTGVDQEVRGEFNTDVFADGVIEAGEASVKVNWWPLDGDEKYWYQIHYSDSTGFDCGWHRQQNDHVDGLDHYQERESPDDEYTYYPFSPSFDHPVGLLWEVVNGRLVERVTMRYGDE